MTLALIAIIIFIIILFNQKVNNSRNDLTRKRETITNVALEKEIYKENVNKIYNKYLIVNEYSSYENFKKICIDNSMPESFIGKEKKNILFHIKYLNVLYESLCSYYWGEESYFFNGEISYHKIVDCPNNFNNYQDGTYINDDSVKNAFFAFMNLINEYTNKITLCKLNIMTYREEAWNSKYSNYNILNYKDLLRMEGFKEKLFALPPLPFIDCFDTSIVDGEIKGVVIYRHYPEDKRKQIEEIIFKHVSILSYNNLNVISRIVYENYPIQYMIWAGITRRELHNRGYAISKDGIHESDWQEWEKKKIKLKEDEEKYPWKYHGIKPYEPSGIKKLTMSLGELKKLKEKQDNYCGGKDADEDLKKYQKENITKK